MRVVTVNRGANDSSGRIRNEASLQANKIDSVMLCIGQLSVEIWPSCHYAALNFFLRQQREGAVLLSWESARWWMHSIHMHAYYLWSESNWRQLSWNRNKMNELTNNALYFTLLPHLDPMLQAARQCLFSQIQIALLTRSNKTYISHTSRAIILQPFHCFAHKLYAFKISSWSLCLSYWCSGLGFSTQCSIWYTSIDSLASFLLSCLIITWILNY